ncbi:MAG: Na/Pi symporter [Cellvibrio sp.]|uniref:Na/Pi cotransporter family protein n=1 Tax=Cellvibrio sp. TaxID=1965322 RepID=UPI002724C0B2|nr:Na/Pi symporter [Cellvibrio sp.]
MDVNTVIHALGGLAMFILAMRLMTDGLMLFAGNHLKQLLGSWTSTPWRGVGVGILVTGVVQSSAAVIIAAIGFVNAGILTLRQAMGVAFGTNVGTTITAWLVSLIGLGLQLDALALPILTLGVCVRLFSSSIRWKGLGDALTGFALFFLGLALLKDAFGGLAQTYSAELGSYSTAGSLTGMILVGFTATLLTQSSSAAIAIVLTAASGGAMSFESAAAAVIGANLGSTSTAALATFRATPAAKRLALSHIVFNLVAGAIALLILPLLLKLVALLGDWINVEGSPAALLALFHSLFNILGVAIMLPLTGVLARQLEKLFRSAEEDMGRPRYLDATLSNTPTLAVSALHKELARLSDILVSLLRDALGGARSTPELTRRAQAIQTLGVAIGNFITGVRPEAMERNTANELAAALYAARYYQESAQLAPGLRRLVQERAQLAEPEANALGKLLEQVERCLEPDLSGEEAQVKQLIEALRNAHREARRQLLEAAVTGKLEVATLERLLEGLDFSRRAIELRVKAGQLLVNRDEAQATTPHPLPDAAPDITTNQPTEN